MLLSQNSLLAANGTRIETPMSIYNRTGRLSPAYRSLNTEMANALRESGAAGPSYANAVSGLGGTRPAGLGFAFGDSWARTQRGVMEFSLPTGQVDNINMAMRYACENAYVAKAMRLKTLFTTKGVANAGGDDSTNEFFDQVHRTLHLQNIFSQSVWMYYTCGLVPIVMPEDGNLDWLQIIDPRMVRVSRDYGKLTCYMVADQRMKMAVADKEGRQDPRNRDYYNAMPKSWRAQLEVAAQKNVSGETLIRLKDGSYIILDNRYNPVSRLPNGFDGTPLQPYFSACEQYRMAMAGQFATSFIAKNIIALVSVGDPKAEGPDLYVRPDDSVLLGLQNTFMNPNQAMWVYGDPTLNVRYITPGKDAFDGAAFVECKEVLKNLLPSPLWFNEGGSSFAAATIEMQELEEEATACQNVFDTEFWMPIHERAAAGRPRIAAKHVKPPQYDRSALRDRVADLKTKNELYGNGGMSIRTLMEAHGVDYDSESQRLKDQVPDVKKGVYMPAFEQKQGIVAAKTYAINKTTDAPGKKPDGGKGGRPKVPGSKPQAESTTSRTPRPSAGK